MTPLPSRGVAILRLSALALPLMGLGPGIERGWLVVNHQKFSDDLRLQFLEDPQAIRRLRFLFGGGP